jgi:PAS domain S-box-containing protein
VKTALPIHESPDIGAANGSNTDGGTTRFPERAPLMTPRKTLDRTADGGLAAGSPRTWPGEPDRDALDVYRTLVERIPGIVYTAEPGETGRWLYASPQIESILGYTAEEWCSDATLWFRCLHPADRERAIAEESRSRDSGEPLNSEYRMIARDGSLIWFHDQATVVSGPDGRGAVLQGVMLDITDRKLAEEKVRDSQARLSAAQRLAQMGSWEYEPARDCLTFSEELYRICGVRPGDLPEGTKATLERLVHPDDLGRVERELAQAARQPGPFRYELRIVRPDGEVRTLENHGDVVVADNGQPVRIVGTVQDVTDRKRAEGALRQSHEQFQSIIDNSPSVIYAKDRSFKYLFANREFGRMFQVDPQEMIGRTDETILPLDVAGRARASDRKVLEEGAVVQEEEVIWRRGGDRTHLTQKFPLRDTDGQIYAVCAISTDITERKAREQELRAEVDWSIRVREAVRESKLVLHSQPILDLQTNTIHQEELLVRMRGGRGFEDLVMPGEFLPPAERFGLVQEIDRWVVAEAVKIAKHRRVEVNLSGKSIGDPDLIKLIETELKQHGTNPADVVFEITETAAAENLEAARDFAWRLRGLGCGFALDDFGTGFGTFAYLKHLPVTFLKIDIEFVRYLAIDPSDQKIVKSIIAVAQNFGVQTIAEGVEHQATLDLLRELGVNYAQGFLIGEPKPVEYVPSR